MSVLKDVTVGCLGHMVNVVGSKLVELVVNSNSFHLVNLRELTQLRASRM